MIRRIAVRGYTTNCASKVDKLPPSFRFPRFARGTVQGFGSPRFARGTAQGFGSPRFARGTAQGFGSPRFVRESVHGALVRFPLLAGGTWRRGFSTAHFGELRLLSWYSSRAR
jgi:hypothetical protein